MQTNIYKKFLYFLSSAFFIVVTFLICKLINSINYKTITSDNTPNTSISKTSNEIEQNMIGIWIPFMELDINSKENTEEKFKQKFENIINETKQYKINNIFVHVRSHGDALYPSNIFPWSHILTGTQGDEPGFDPLKYMIEKTHENGLRFHAWINPLRIKLKNYPEQLSKNNPYFKFDPDKHFLNHTNGLSYNPAYPEVRKLIIDGIKEIIENYNVDGIHFDDYFYPEEQDMLSVDEAYKENLSQINPIKSVSEWRAYNINTLINEIYKSIKETNPQIIFGISPSGSIEKCYNSGADVKLWLSSDKYIDYICPQIYWSLDFKDMPFEKTAITWKNIHKNKNVKLYSGLALYKIGTDLDNNTWTSRDNIISTEIKIINNLNYDGFILYSSEYLNKSHTQIELNNLKNEIINLS